MKQLLPTSQVIQVVDYVPKRPINDEHFKYN